MMTKIGIRLLALALILVALAACSDDQQTTNGDQITVVASTSIIASLASQIGGDHVAITTLIGPGADPHNFEPLPSDWKTLDSAALVLLNGIGLDDDLRDDIQRVVSDIDIITVTDGIETIPFEVEATDSHHHEDDDGHHHEGHSDPHVWLDPLRAVQMAENIAGALVNADPAHADEYRAGVTAVTEQLTNVDAQITELMRGIPESRRTVLVNHDAFGYFADRYGLTIAGAVLSGAGEATGTSAGHLADLIKLVEREGVSAILAGAEHDPVVARQLANDTGIILIDGLYGDQLGDADSGASTLDTMLLSNAKKISQALSEYH